MGASAHYQKTVTGEVVYWNPEDRQHYAFNIEKNAARGLKRHRIPKRQQAREGASVNTGAWTNSARQYNPLPIPVSDVRNL